LEPARHVRLPLSRTKRSQATYAKLLKLVDPRSRTAFEWKGNFLSPGTTIPEANLWPNGTFPRTPLIVEFAGAETPARGHARHLSDNTVILWRYERSEGKDGKFVEVGRVVAPAGMWRMLLEPLVRDAMAREAGFVALDFDLIRSRITRVIAAELDMVGNGDRARLLTLVHDELAGRIAEWSGSEFERAGFGPSPRVF
jgi:hypothetical protein